MASAGLTTENTNINRQCLVIVLHELRQVEKNTQKIWRNLLRLDGVLNVLNQIVLVLFEQLTPT